MPLLYLAIFLARSVSLARPAFACLPRGVITSLLSRLSCRSESISLPPPPSSLALPSLMSLLCLYFAPEAGIYFSVRLARSLAGVVMSCLSFVVSIVSEYPVRLARSLLCLYFFAPEAGIYFSVRLARSLAGVVMLCLSFVVSIVSDYPVSFSLSPPTEKEK